MHMCTMHESSYCPAPFPKYHLQALVTTASHVWITYLQKENIF